MNWQAVIKELRDEADRQRKVIVTANHQEIRFGAAVVLANISALANALEAGLPKIMTDTVN